MNLSFSEELRDEVRDRTDIVHVVSGSVRLKKSGANYIGLCPFHKEKTPSFSVNPTKRIFYCFGCHEGGDVFRFVMKKENLSFPVVLEKLALAAGIDLSRYERSGSNTTGLARLHEAHTAALGFFCKQLETNKAARDYLSRRGLNEATWTSFSMGYAPNAWTGAYDHLKKLGFTDGELLAGGLIRRNEKNGSCYDYFRNRIVFPIRDERSRVVAFGGRILSDEKPKYLNSPETPIYSKGRSLFNLDRITPDVGASGLVLVEGYMDVVGLAHCGVTNAVATLGTALTEPQIRKIARLSKRLFLAYDPDEAGVRATVRSLELLESSGLEMKVLRLPEGVDPDELVIQKGKEAWMQVLDKALEVEDYLFDHVIAPFNLDNPAERKEAFRELKRTFSFLPNPESRERFMRRVADRLQLGDDVVRVNFTVTPTKSISDEVLQKTSRMDKDSPGVLKERYLLACFLTDPALYATFRDQIDVSTLEDPGVRRAMDILAKLATGGQTAFTADSGSSLSESVMDLADSDDLRSFLAGLTVDFVLPEGGGEAAAGECLSLLRRHTLERQRRELTQQLKVCRVPAEREVLNKRLTQVLQEVTRSSSDGR